MKNFRFIVLLSLSALCLSADTLTGNGSLQTWNAGVLGTVSNPTTGGPYWNNTSGDGAAYNIGWCMTGTGNCSIANPPGAVSYYGNGTAAASTIGFSNTGSAQVATLDGMFTNQNGVPPTGTNVFGWYTFSNGSIVLHQLFDSTEAVGTTATFSPTASYGFYFENIQTAGLTPPATANYFWFTNDSLDYGTGAATIDPGTQHFAVFSAANGYYLGMEDTPAATSDFDYNDMVVNVAPAPEPASIALMLGGLGLLGLAIRRRP